MQAVEHHRKKVRFFRSICALEQEKAQGRSGQIADRLMRCDLVILDELGYLPFSSSGGALLFHLLSKLYEKASVAITTNLSFSEWAACSATPRSTAMLDRLTHHCHIVETGNDSFRFKASAASKGRKEKGRKLDLSMIDSPVNSRWKTRVSSAWKSTGRKLLTHRWLHLTFPVPLARR